MKIFHAKYERDQEGNWLVELVEEPRVHTFGRTFAKAKANLIDAVKLWFELDRSEFSIDHQFPMLPEVVKAVEDTISARQREEDAANHLHDVQERAVRTIVDAGFSLRDAATLLGLSHQRVHQVAAEAVSRR